MFVHVVSGRVCVLVVCVCVCVGSGVDMRECVCVAGCVHVLGCGICM